MSDERDYTRNLRIRDRRYQLRQMTEGFAMVMTKQGDMITKGKVRQALDLAAYLLGEVDEQVKEDFNLAEDHQFTDDQH